MAGVIWAHSERLEGLVQDLEIGGGRRLEMELLAGDRVEETEDTGVERLPAEAAIRDQTASFKGLSLKR